MARKAGKAKVLSKQEFDRVVTMQKSNSRTGQRNLLILHLSFFLGLRCKEIAGLTFDDVFEQNGIKQEITLSITKGNKIRQSYLTNPKIITLLKQHFKRNSEAGNLFQMEQQPLIISERGSAFSPNSLQQLFSRLYQQAGIHGASSHAARRRVHPGAMCRRAGFQPAR